MYDVLLCVLSVPRGRNTETNRGSSCASNPLMNEPLEIKYYIIVAAHHVKNYNLFSYNQSLHTAGGNVQRLYSWTRARRVRHMSSASDLSTSGN